MSIFENPFRKKNPKETPLKPNSVGAEGLTPEEQEMRDLERDMNDGMEIIVPKPKGERKPTPGEEQEMRDLEKDLNDPESIMQTPEEILEEKKLKEGIETANTLDDLITLFGQTRGIMTSNEFCSSEKMIEILELAKDDPDSAITYITKNLGLRDKVKEILKMRDLEKDLNDPESIIQTPEEILEEKKRRDEEQKMRDLEKDMNSGMENLMPEGEERVIVKEPKDRHPEFESEAEKLSEEEERKIRKRLKEIDKKLESFKNGQNKPKKRRAIKKREGEINDLEQEKAELSAKLGVEEAPAPQEEPEPTAAPEERSKEAPETKEEKEENEFKKKVRLAREKYVSCLSNKENIKEAKKEYLLAINEYKQKMLEAKETELEGNPKIKEELEKYAKELLIETTVKEATEIYNLKTDKKAEKSGWLMKKGLEAVSWYRKQKTRKKILVAGLFFTVGLAAGTYGGAVGVALGAGAITGKTLQRVLSGAGTALGLEAWMKRSQEKKTEEDFLEQFDSESLLKSLREQNEELDNKIFELTDKKKGEEIRRSAIAAVGGVLVGSGAVSKAISERIPDEWKDWVGKKIGSIFGTNEAEGQTSPSTANMAKVAGTVATPEGPSPSALEDFYGHAPVESSDIMQAHEDDSLWKMIGHRLSFYKDFNELNEAQKTYVIDAVKDQVAKNPEEYGLTDIDEIQAGQKIDLSQIFGNQPEVHGLINEAHGLTEGQMKNILAYEGVPAEPEWKLVGLENQTHFYKTDLKDFSNEHGIKGEILSPGGDKKIPEVVNFYGDNGKNLVYSTKIHDNESSKDFLVRAKEEVNKFLAEKDAEGSVEKLEWEKTGATMTTGYGRADLENFSNDHGITGKVFGHAEGAKGSMTIDSANFYDNDGEIVYSTKIHDNESSKDFLVRAKEEVNKFLAEKDAKTEKPTLESTSKVNIKTPSLKPEEITTEPEKPETPEEPARPIEKIGGEKKMVPEIKIFDGQENLDQESYNKIIHEIKQKGLSMELNKQIITDWSREISVLRNELEKFKLTPDQAQGRLDRIKDLMEISKNTYGQNVFNQDIKDFVDNYKIKEIPIVPKPEEVMTQPEKSEVAPPPQEAPVKPGEKIPGETIKKPAGEINQEEGMRIAREGNEIYQRETTSLLPPESQASGKEADEVVKFFEDKKPLGRTGIPQDKINYDKARVFTDYDGDTKNLSQGLKETIEQYNEGAATYEETAGNISKSFNELTDLKNGPLAARESFESWKFCQKAGIKVDDLKLSDEDSEIVEKIKTAASEIDPQKGDTASVAYKVLEAHRDSLAEQMKSLNDNKDVFKNGKFTSKFLKLIEKNEEAKALFDKYNIKAGAATEYRKLAELYDQKENLRNGLLEKAKQVYEAADQQDTASLTQKFIEDNFTGNEDIQKNFAEITRDTLKTKNQDLPEFCFDKLIKRNMLVVRYYMLEMKNGNGEKALETINNYFRKALSDNTNPLTGPGTESLKTKFLEDWLRKNSFDPDKLYKAE